MPRNGAGTYSLPTGNPVVSGTPIESTWANSTLGDIAAEMTASLSRAGAGGMTGQFKAADGTVSAPGVSFLNETATGFYRESAGTLSLSMQGSKAASFTSTTASILTSGVDRLSIASDGKVTFGSTLSSQFIFDANNRFTLGGSAITPNANVAIAGTTPPITGGQAHGLYVSTTTTSSAGGYSVNGIRVDATTQAASFSLANLVLFNANTVTKGSGSTVSLLAGFQASSALADVSGTINMGFYGALGVGAGANWNLYMGGDAPNYTAGELRVGTTSSTGNLNTNNTKVVGGIFTSLTGTTSAGHNTTTAILSLPSGRTAGAYLVNAYIDATNDASNYSAAALVMHQGTTSYVAISGNAALLTITSTGGTVSVKQTSGATQTVSYNVMRLV